MAAAIQPRWSVLRTGTRGIVLVGMIVGIVRIAVAADTPKTGQVERGRALFEREWLPDDPRSPGGDGLGPVFNDSSCVACHNLGGVGGGGPNNKNVDVLSAIAIPGPQGVQVPGAPKSSRDFMRAARNSFAARTAVPASQATDELKKAASAAKDSDPDKLVKLHPGFGTAKSVIVHKFGTDPNYRKWRAGSDYGNFARQTCPEAWSVPRPCSVRDGGSQDISYHREHCDGRIHEAG